MKILDYIEIVKKERKDFNQKRFAMEMMGTDRDRQGYLSKLARFEVVPSLMVSLVLEVLSDGRIKPRDLITGEQLAMYLEKRNIINFYNDLELKSKILIYKSDI